MLSNAEIKEKLKGIFEEQFGIDFSKGGEDVLEQHLLGGQWCFYPSYLLYLFFAIEKVFGIKIEEEDILTGRFSTFNQIADIIYKRQQVER
jgi:acyl carrier protein